MTYPVAVVATCRRSRKRFFDGFCLPSINVNGPCQVMVEEGDPVPEARIEAVVRKARMTYVAFVGDDVILHAEFLSTLLRALRDRPEAGFAFCDFAAVPWPGEAWRFGASVRPLPFAGPSWPAASAWVARRELWLAGRAEIGHHVPEVLFMKLFAGPK